jgi:hypothetical protein
MTRSRQLSIWFEWIDVQHWSREFPVFHVSSFTHFGTQVESLVRSKLSRTYESSWPIELICFYASHSRSTFETGPRERLRAQCRSALDCAPFRRIWIFDPSGGHIMDCYPSAEADALSRDEGWTPHVRSLE